MKFTSALLLAVLAFTATATASSTSEPPQTKLSTVNVKAIASQPWYKRFLTTNENNEVIINIPESALPDMTLREKLEVLKVEKFSQLRDEKSTEIRDEVIRKALDRDEALEKLILQIFESKKEYEESKVIDMPASASVEDDAPHMSREEVQEAYKLNPRKELVVVYAETLFKAQDDLARWEQEPGDEEFKEWLRQVKESKKESRPSEDGAGDN